MTEPTRTEAPRSRWLFNAAALVVVVAGLRAGAPFILPLLLALFISLLSFPIVNAIRRLGVRPVLAVLTTVVIEVCILLALGVLIAPALNSFIDATPGYVEQINVKARQTIESLAERGINVGDVFVFENIDPGQLVDFAGGVVRRTLSGVATAISFSTLVLFLLVFTLIEGAGMPKKLQAAFGPQSRATKYVAGVVQEVQHYLGVKTLVSAATGLLVWAAMWGLGIPYAPVWGLLAFLLNYVPAIGSIIAAIPTVIVTLLLFGPARAAVVAACYIAVNVIFGNVIEPTLMGRRFGLSTLVVFVSLIFWGWVWGPLGMLLSVPLTMMIKIALDESEDMRWAAILLGRTKSLLPRPAEEEEIESADESEPAEDSALESEA
jgi:predicted PurR-regulated permease PerM